MHTTEQKPMQTSRSPRVRTILLIALSAVTATTAIRIEILNKASGGRLPSRELHDDGSPVKWRQLTWTDETAWRQTLGPRDADGRPISRPLTSDEQAQMIRDIHQARAANALRDVVSSWGIAQYILVPISLVLAFLLLVEARARRSTRLLGGLGLCVAIAAGVLMFQRQYFTSLGW